MMPARTFLRTPCQSSGTLTAAASSANVSSDTPPFFEPIPWQP